MKHNPFQPETDPAPDPDQDTLVDFTAMLIGAVNLPQLDDTWQIVVCPHCGENGAVAAGLPGSVIHQARIQGKDHPILIRKSCLIDRDASLAEGPETIIASLLVRLCQISESMKVAEIIMIMLNLYEEGKMPGTSLVYILTTTLSGMGYMNSHPTEIPFDELHKIPAQRLEEAIVSYIIDKWGMPRTPHLQA